MKYRRNLIEEKKEIEKKHEGFLFFDEIKLGQTIEIEKKEENLLQKENFINLEENFEKKEENTVKSSVLMMNIEENIENKTNNSKDLSEKSIKMQKEMIIEEIPPNSNKKSLEN